MPTCRKLVIKDDADAPMRVYAEVYVPLAMDTDQDAMRDKEVEDMAHDFLKSGRVLKIDINHDLQESGCAVIESYIVRYENPDFKLGSWVLGVEIYDPELKDAVRKGDLNGFSFYSDDLKETTVVDVPVTIVRKLAGTVEESTSPDIEKHDHESIIEFDEDGNVVPTFTSEVLEHRHPILRTTSTETEADHAHRIVY